MTMRFIIMGTKSNKNYPVLSIRQSVNPYKIKYSSIANKSSVILKNQDLTTKCKSKHFSNSWLRIGEGMDTHLMTIINISLTIMIPFKKTWGLWARIMNGELIYHHLLTQVKISKINKRKMDSWLISVKWIFKIILINR